MLHHVAPVTGRVADRQEDRLVLVSGARRRPRRPTDTSRPDWPRAAADTGCAHARDGSWMPCCHTIPPHGIRRRDSRPGTHVRSAARGGRNRSARARRKLLRLPRSQRRRQVDDHQVPDRACCARRPATCASWEPIRWRIRSASSAAIGVVPEDLALFERLTAGGDAVVHRPGARHARQRPSRDGRRICCR